MTILPPLEQKNHEVLASIITASKYTKQSALYPGLESSATKNGHTINAISRGLSPHEATQGTLEVIQLRTSADNYEKICTAGPRLKPRNGPGTEPGTKTP